MSAAPAARSDRAPVGVGVIGCGRIARAFHLPVLRDHPGARLVGVADPDPDARRAATAAVPGVPAVADVERLLAAPGLEAVVVCVPTDRHPTVATAAFDAGLHVYVEKPLAVDAAAAADIEAAWRRSGRSGAVGFNFRFHPLVRAAAEHLRTGGLGELVAVRAVFSSSPRELPAWKRHRRTGGGALLDLACHHLDLLRHLLGTEITRVSASVASVHGDADTAHLQVDLADAPSAQLLATLRAAQSDRVELLGDRATLVIDRMARRDLELLPARGPATLGERLRAATDVSTSAARAWRDGLRPPPEPSFAAALGAFVRTVGTGATAEGSIAPGGDDGHDGDAARLADVADGTRVAAVIDAAERSASTGRRVEVGTDTAA